MLGGRQPRMVARELLAAANWRALARSPFVYRRPRRALGRYIFGRGAYPLPVELRTPVGPVAATLHHPHDAMTVHEVFAREDYAAGGDLRVAVDIGSNIGISALYFLTRSAEARCWLYEPVPANADRLQRNLASFAGRWRLARTAVSDVGGTVDFGVESTGRYGGIGVATERSIQVSCLHVAEVLAEVLAEVDEIDVLKLDTEGSEARTIAAIPREQLLRIRTIYFECDHAPRLHPELFEQSERTSTVRLERRRDL